MKKRKVMAILLTAACISSLCGGLTVRADGKQKLTITYRPVTTQQGDTYEEYINKTYENWDKKDDVELVLNKIESTDSDYLTKIQLLMQDDSQCGDLVYEDTFQLTSDAAAGYLANLDDYLADYDAWNDGKSYVEATKAATYYDGSYYGFHPVQTPEDL